MADIDVYKRQETGEVLAPANEMITPQQAKKIVAAGIKEVQIRSVLTCKSENGVCRKCYGANMATGNLVDIEMCIRDRSYTALSKRFALLKNKSANKRSA